MGPFAGERGEQDSLAPIQLEGSIDQDLARMQRGKGVQLLVIAVIAVGTVGGGVLAARRLDRERGFEQTSAAAQQLQHAHVAAYRACALPLAQASSFEAPERLYAAFADMIERSTNTYARVLALCEPKLTSLPSALSAMRAPADLQPEWTRLKASAVALQDSAIALRRALEDPEESADYVALTARADHLAKALFAYQDRDDELRRAIESKR